jgi:hypothetical protein
MRRCTSASRRGNFGCSRRDATCARSGAWRRGGPARHIGIAHVGLAFWHRLKRCRYKGLPGIKRWVGFGVIADNPINLGHAPAADR